MNYIIRVSLKGEFCKDCIYPVSNTLIKVYKPIDTANTTTLAKAPVKETFHQVSEEYQKLKQKYLLGEGAINKKGEFEITLNEKDYVGGVVDIDWYCCNSPIPIEPRPKKQQSLQFHLTTLQPRWQLANDQNSIALFSYVVPAKWFGHILGLFDIWSVCGKVTDSENGQPVTGANVFAHDVDWLQDDFLGSAYTDADGKFLILYNGAKFRQTLLPWLKEEWPAGPDYYFKLEYPSGQVLLQEDRQTGRQSDRANADNCFYINFSVQGVTPYSLFTGAGNFSLTPDINWPPTFLIHSIPN